MPLLLSRAAGPETRIVIGIISLYGVVATILLTLYLLPAVYDLLLRRAG